MLRLQVCANPPDSLTFEKKSVVSSKDHIPSLEQSSVHLYSEPQYCERVPKSTESQLTDFVLGLRQDQLLWKICHS